MQLDATEFPRLIIAALRGGSGKTILSIGVIAALNKLGKSVAAFKKGPDYIDAGWLALAAGRPCYNLDSFLLSQSDNLQSFLSHSADNDISIIEGNRGLYDGIDLEGSTSTAELAKLIKCPVVLCVDCTKITRTMAAVVAGCCQFDPAVMISAVILNRVANTRHEKKLRDSIEHYCGMPVIGAIPKLGEQHFPERHLGLVPTPEHDWANNSIEAISRIAEQHIDLDALVTIAQKAPGLDTEGRKQNAEVGMRKSEIEVQEPVTSDQKPASSIEPPVSSSQYPAPSLQHPATSIEQPVVRIGIIKDSAFQFYYPENIDALAESGADIVYVSPLKDNELPELDALYIGGGFPETHAAQLSASTKFNFQLKARAEDGFPIYAECGGLMYLGEQLVLENKSYPMVGILPVTFDFFNQPQGHGYTIVKVEGQNPYYEVGSEIRGHEFHYSRVSKRDSQKSDLVFRMQRGAGIENDRDGILYKNVLATYTHVHALGTPGWAPALIRNAIKFKNR
ncbi:Protein similar to cobyrinic acid a,c-diamide synthetase clustered with dissimilatory sulfite reductase [Olavius sp. associated proteobacterium Delta 1]|nr:Protein similar to cobyrinic acid a,c-diamide synthetase clustered with dissimilatory sulfite reductase [Olavius sp. associated proteobacterium Delta 1]